MQKITLYRYNRPDGGVTISPVKPDGEYTELFRLIAEEGHMLTDGVNHTECVDTEELEVWEEEEGIIDAEASEILLGGIV